MASFIYSLIFSISDMKGFLITRAPQEERLLEHVVTGFYACIFVTSLITNAFLFTVFLRNKHFRDLSTYLIVQMAAADVLYLCVTCSIVAIKNLDIELNHITCKVLLYVEGAARFASSLSLMLISLERSTAVCSPSLCYTIRKVARVKEKVGGNDQKNVLHLWVICKIDSGRMVHEG